MLNACLKSFNPHPLRHSLKILDKELELKIFSIQLVTLSRPNIRTVIKAKEESLKFNDCVISFTLSLMSSFCFPLILIHILMDKSKYYMNWKLKSSNNTFCEDYWQSGPVDFSHLKEEISFEWNYIPNLYPSLSNLIFSLVLNLLLYWVLPVTSLINSHYAWRFSPD